MTDDEVAKFLDEGRKLQVATLGPSGAPHLTTMFYGMVDGLVTFWTYGSSQKAVNLRRDPRISVLVEDGTAYDELRGVSITGRAEIVDDRDRVVAIGLELLSHNQGITGRDGREMVEAQATKRVVVVVHPDRIASWDHRKL